MRKNKEMVMADICRKADVAERAYKIETRKQLQVFNDIFGLKEKTYPAIYVDMFGMMTPSDIGHEQFLRYCGYEIISLAQKQIM